MKIQELLTEAPLADYEPIGDFTKPGPFKAVDRKLITHPVNQLKTIKFFEKTPYDFRLFFSNIPGTGKYRETGAVPLEKIHDIFGDAYAEKIIRGHENAITIVYVGNQGDRAVIMKPWIMAHRFGHAASATQRFNKFGEWKAAEQKFFKTVNEKIKYCYYKTSTNNTNRDISDVDWNMAPEYNALFNAIGTQRSSRENEIRRPYEFMYEMLAQYIATGAITLKAMPLNVGYGKKAWGKFTHFLYAKPEFRDESVRAQTSTSLAQSMEELFEYVLGSMVGKILVM